MPVSYAIQGHIVRTTFSGLIGHRDPSEHNLKLRRDPAFDPHFSELVEFDAVSEIKVDHQDISSFVARDPFSENSRRAFVVGSATVLYGIARMYQILSNDAPSVEIFGTVAEAVLWLNEPAFAARAGEPC